MPHPPDFDLAINVAGTGYTVQVQAAFGVGEFPPPPFALPLNLADLPRQRRDVAEWIKQVRVKLLTNSAIPSPIS